MLAKVLIDLFCVIFRLTFQFSPSSKVYGFSEVDLSPNGGDKVHLPHLTRTQCLSLLVKHLVYPTITTFVISLLLCVNFLWNYLDCKKSLIFLRNGKASETCERARTPPSRRRGVRWEWKTFALPRVFRSFSLNLRACSRASFPLLIPNIMYQSREVCFMHM